MILNHQHRALEVILDEDEQFIMGGKHVVKLSLHGGHIAIMWHLILGDRTRHPKEQMTWIYPANYDTLPEKIQKLHQDFLDQGLDRGPR